ARGALISSQIAFLRRVSAGNASIASQRPANGRLHQSIKSMLIGVPCGMSHPIRATNNEQLIGTGSRPTDALRLVSILFVTCPETMARVLFEGRALCTGVPSAGQKQHIQQSGRMLLSN